MHYLFGILCFKLCYDPVWAVLGFLMASCMNEINIIVLIVVFGFYMCIKIMKLMQDLKLLIKDIYTLKFK